jgi:hypothetical protein
MTIPIVTTTGWWLGARFSVVVKALCYKPEGEFLNLLNLSAALGLGVHPASNRNEYQYQKNNVSGEYTRPESRGNSLTTICEPIV